MRGPHSLLAAVLLASGLLTACHPTHPRRTERGTSNRTLDDVVLLPTAGQSLPPGAVRQFGKPRLVLWDGELLWGMGLVGQDRLWLISGGGGNYTRAVFRVHDISSGKLRFAVGAHRMFWEVSPDGKCTVLSGANRYQDNDPLRAFDLERGRALPAFVPEMKLLFTSAGNHAVSSDCRLAAGYTKERQLAVWRIKDGRLVRRLPFHYPKDPAQDGTVSFPDGDSILTVNRSTKKAFFTTTGKSMPVPTGDKLLDVSVSAAAKLAAARFERGPAALFHLPKGTPFRAAWAAGVRWVVLGWAGRRALTWDGRRISVVTLATGQHRKLTQGLAPKMLALSAEDSRAVIVDSGRLRVFDLLRNKELVGVGVTSDAEIRLEGNGEICIVEKDPTPVIVDVRYGQQLHLRKVETYSHAAVTSHSVILRAHSTWAPIRAYARSRRPTRTAKPGKPLSVGGSLYRIQFSHDGKFLCTRNLATLVCYSILNTQRALSVKIGQPSVDRMLHLSGAIGFLGSNHSISLLELQPGRPVPVLDQIPAPKAGLGSLPSCDLSPKGELLVCDSDNEKVRFYVFDRQRRRWSTLPFRWNRPEEQRINGVERLRWWKTRWIVTAETMEYHLRDEVIATEVPSGAERVLWRRAPLRFLECGPSIGPRGHIAAGGQGVVRLWRSPTDEHPIVFRGLPDRCTALHVRRDGTVLALMNNVYSRSVVLSLRPGAKPRKLLTLSVPDVDHDPVAFSPGGRYLATTHQQSSVLVWRLW